MNGQSFWVKAAIILVAIAAGVYLVQSLGRLWGFMGDLIMIIFFGWLVGSVLVHFVNGLMNVPFMRRPVAIVLIYLALIILVADFVLLVLPAAANQLLDLVDNLPNLVDRIPKWLEGIEGFFNRFGIEIDLASRYRAEVSIEELLSEGVNFLADNVVSIVQAIKLEN